MASNSPQARLEQGVLQVSGTLDRSAVIALWPQLQAMGSDVQRLGLAQVSHVDSAGVALLAELVARAKQQGRTLSIDGAPSGLTDLVAAYRLSPDLDFNAPSAAS